MTPVFNIIRSPVYAQLQDLGRFGYMQQGFSRSGPMDSIAFAYNNQMLGNATDATQLEVTLGGLTLQTLTDTTVAISGAHANGYLNDKPLINFNAVNVYAGDVLKFDYAAKGVYFYIAITGGFDAPRILDSHAATKRLSIFPGGQLQTGSVLYSSHTDQRTCAQGIKRKDIVNYQTSIIEVIPAYQFDEFSVTAKRRFCAQIYHIEDSNRMGTRLEGEKNVEFSGEERLSEGLLPGAIQITNKGQPIVLQQDAQTIGGYPKIGYLDAINRSIISQMPRKRALRFRFKSI